MKEKIDRILVSGWGSIGILSVAFAAIIVWVLPLSVDSFWSIAGGVSTINSIDIFSDGIPSSTPSLDNQITALLSILVYLVIGPGLLVVFGIHREDSSPDDSNNSSFIGFIAGLIIVFGGIISFGIESAMYAYANTHQNSVKSAAKSAATDQVRYNLTRLATESYQYMVLPKEQGGGGGSFDGLEITDLPSYSELEYGTYQFSDLESDTLLRIAGSALPDHPDARAESDKIELIVQVMPEDIIRWENQ